MTFTEFLRDQEERLRSEEAAREGKKRQWTASVLSLIDEMKAWLKEFDQKGLLKLKDRTIELSEESIGTYDIHALEIWLGSKAVSVSPVARDVIGPRWKPGEGTWSGRVDLAGDTSTYEIYMFSGDGGPGSWYIRDTQKYVLQPFTKEQFDSALVELFA
jgi:hypothetical protein